MSACVYVLIVKRHCQIIKKVFGQKVSCMPALGDVIVMWRWNPNLQNYTHPSFWIFLHWIIFMAGHSCLLDRYRGIHIYIIYNSRHVLFFKIFNINYTCIRNYFFLFGQINCLIIIYTYVYVCMYEGDPPYVASSDITYIALYVCICMYFHGGISAYNMCRLLIISLPLPIDYIY